MTGLVSLDHSDGVTRLDDTLAAIDRANSEDPNRLIVGGEGHKTGKDPDTRQRYAALNSD